MGFLLQRTNVLIAVCENAIASNIHLTQILLSNLRPLCDQVCTHIKTYMSTTVRMSFDLIRICSWIVRVHGLVLAHLRHTSAIETLVHYLPLMGVIPAHRRAPTHKLRRYLLIMLLNCPRF